MKQFLLLLFPVLSFNQGVAQTNIFPSTGGAGIGTTSPGTTALTIKRSNTDGGATDAPVIEVSNVSTTNPSGNGYNIAWANFLAGNGSVLAQFGANYGVGGGSPFNGGSGCYITTRTDHPIIFATGSATSEKLRITSGGNIGIGTTDPQAKLHVKMNESGSAAMHTSNLSSLGYGQYISSGGIDATRFVFAADYNNPTGSFAGGTRAFTIMADGKVGVGEASPSARLHIKTTTADNSASDFQLVDNAGGSILSIRNDQKFTVGSGTQSTQLVIAGTGDYAGIYSPSYASTSNNIISYKDYIGNTRMTFDMSNGTDGKLGIGITAPTEKLDVNGNIKATGFILPTGAAAGKVLTSDANGNAAWQTAAGSGTAGWAFGGNAVPASSTFGTTSNYDLPIVTNNTERMRIGANGNVGIGTTNITSYKLSVDGNIRTRKVRVDQDTWADYVFDNNYQLRSIKEVEEYIQAEKHLPDVPSAAEVKKEGLDLGDNQAILLKKIEELTLYVIQQQKQLEAQQQKIDMLEKKMNGNK